MEFVPVEFVEMEPVTIESGNSDLTEIGILNNKFNTYVLDNDILIENMEHELNDKIEKLKLDFKKENDELSDRLKIIGEIINDESLVKSIKYCYEELYCTKNLLFEELDKLTKILDKKINNNFDKNVHDSRTVESKSDRSIHLANKNIMDLVNITGVNTQAVDSLQNGILKFTLHFKNEVSELRFQFLCVITINLMVYIFPLIFKLI
jgi:hypothetical protein